MKRDEATVIWRELTRLGSMSQNGVETIEDQKTREREYRARKTKIYDGAGEETETRKKGNRTAGLIVVSM